LAQPWAGSGVNPVQLVLVGIGVPPEGWKSFGPAPVAPAVPVIARLSRAVVATAARALAGGGRRMRLRIAGVSFLMWWWPW
jgi:hypothetical protein